MKNLLKKVLVSLLRAEAAYALKRHTPRVIAVVGSVGKTSTKDAIAAALSTSLNVRKSEKSFNSDIGIPLAILGLKNPWTNPIKWLGALATGLLEIFSRDFPDTLVLEVGADRPGDISSLATWLQTDIVVATQFAEVPVHIENFQSRDAVLQEKLSILHTLKSSGRLILNADDKEFTRAAKGANRSAEVYTYGLMPPAYTLASSEQYTLNNEGNVEGVSFKIECEGKVFPVRVTGVLGDQHIYPLLASFATGKALGVNAVYILDGLNTINRQPARMRIIEGVKGSTLIDDSYNSSPIATRRALETLKKAPAKGKKIAMLGDMLELGDHSREEHERAGALATECADILVAVGRFARQTAEGALESGMSESMVLQFEDSRKAGKYVEQLTSDGDLILIKGSQGTRMERAVLEIMAHPERRKELLARQEDEWEKR